MLRTLVRYLSRIISYIIPQSKIFVFFSYPNFTDNPYALYLYILSMAEYREYKKVWIIDYNEPGFDSRIQHIKKIDNSTIVVKRNSWGSLWYYYRSKFFFFSHSLYSSFFLKDKNKRINLWHGMPLKRIAAMQKNTTYNGVTSDLLISTSKMFQEIMARSFIQPLEKVLICGQPRNDLFWEDTNFFAETGIDKDNYSKIGLWLPTYRSSFNEDGSILNEGNFDNFLSFLRREDINVLNAILVQLNYLLIVKFHPMDVLNDEQVPNFSNIKFYNKYNFDYQLYPLLGKMDFLLTDYSSVWVDYEILNKPIGFVLNDMEQYGNDRGFTIDNLIEKLPGKIITDFESLQSFLSAPSLEHNQEIVWNKYKDNKSSERMMNYLDSVNDD